MAVTTAGNSVLSAHPRLDYNDSEREYSVHVRSAVMRLLEGDEERLDLLTKYHRDPNRLTALRVPDRVDVKQLRVSRVEEILCAAIDFLDDRSDGGLVSQSKDSDRGVIVQMQDFTTRFPHIDLHRRDTFDAEKGELLESQWCARRVQNNRNQLRLNRALEYVIVGLELFMLRR